MHSYMAISGDQMAFLASARLAVYLGPGPIMMAMVARSLSGGFRASLPLVLGVSTGDLLCCIAA